MFHQIIREEAIPLSLSLKPRSSLLDVLAFASLERKTGYKGRTADEVAADMERIIDKIEKGA
jgi:antitoxin component of RelBE/YafQ-DinJ toxin-antitoxin module